MGLDKGRHIYKTTITMDKYQKEAMKTAGEYADPTTYGAFAIAGEVGEVVDALKKKIFHGVPVTNEVIAKELGDVLWGVAFLARALGYSLGEIGYMNLEKLAARYPEGRFVPGGGIREGAGK